jgi:hypothetical protein
MTQGKVAEARGGCACLLRNFRVPGLAKLSVRRSIVADDRVRVLGRGSEKT